MKVLIGNIMHLIAGGDGYNEKSEYKSRIYVAGYVVFGALVAGYALWAFSGVSVNSAAFETSVLGHFHKAYTATDPAVIASELDQGVAKIESIGYDKGFPNWYVPATPERDLAILTQSYRQVASAAHKVAALDPSTEAYQLGVRSLRTHEGWPATGSSNWYANGTLALYKARYVREAGVLGAIQRGGEYALLTLIIWAVVVLIALDFLIEGVLTEERFIDKYWDAGSDGPQPDSGF